MATVEPFPNRTPSHSRSRGEAGRASRRPTSRPSRRCSARSSSTTTPTTASRTSCASNISSRRFIAASTRTPASLIRAGKLATPITLKTFLGDHDLGGGVTVPQYLARLVAEATTVINAHDYGRTIHDLAVRRELINIGEDIVNVAFDAPIDSTPREQIEDAERRLYQIAETGKYGGGFQRFSDALKLAVDMAAKAYERDGHLSGISTGLDALDHKMGGLQASDLIILAGRPAMGKTALATNIAFNVARAYRGEVKARRLDGDRQRRHRRLLLARNVVGAIGDPHHRRAVRRLLLAHPARRHHRTGVPSRLAGDARDAVDPVLHRPDRRHLDRPARRPRAPPQAPEGARPAGRRLSAIADRRRRPRAKTACRN